MSKLNYLTVILILCAVGYVVVGQMKSAIGMSHDLLADEATKKINLRIDEVYRLLKRFPKSGREFETLVLGTLNFKGDIFIKNFKKGNTSRPASFCLKVGGGKSPRQGTVVLLHYFGSDYRGDISYKGRLLRM
ncbi:MAG: hypothetical protein GY765_25635 [bacterium]|nr:hypothetical protein [bacterium]